MKKLFILAIILLFATQSAFSQQWSILPQPQQMQTGQTTVPVKKLKSVRYITDSSLGEEAYRLDVTEKGVTIASSTKRGKFYAQQTLNQIREQYADAASLPALAIQDYPQYGYRGFMLDVSRHFFTVAELKKMIDVMARYKMNVFHWHLTDDHGWRAEIRKWPLLTQVGSIRSDNWQTDFHLDESISTPDQKYYAGKGGYTGQQYGPYYYTQKEMKEIVRYCAQRNIEVLPEVDMPGHFKAAMAAYPQFSCNPQEEHKVWTARWGVNADVLNVGNQLAIEFAMDILDELCDIFPYPYIHIGGDECPTSSWEKNQQCQDKMQRLGLKHVRALQSHFIREISQHVAKKGKKIICWNESITAEGADLDMIRESGATIFCWVGSKPAARKALSLGLDVMLTEIHTNDGSYYINRRPSNEEGEPDGAAPGDDTVQKTYTFNPLPDVITEEQMKHVWGVQATFWTEWVGTQQHLEYLALPKLLCVAEAGWTSPSLKDWNNFRQRLTDQTRWLDRHGYIYSRHWMENYKPRK